MISVLDESNSLNGANSLPSPKPTNLTALLKLFVQIRLYALAVPSSLVKTMPVTSTTCSENFSLFLNRFVPLWHPTQAMFHLLVLVGHNSFYFKFNSLTVLLAFVISS